MGRELTEVKALEIFVYKVYSRKGVITLHAMVGPLQVKKNLVAEMLPPIRTTLMPSIVWTNFICMGDKSYISPNPCFPPLEEKGWLLHERVYLPLKCLSPPAPRAVLDLVKCGCRTLYKGTCSCVKNKLSCTPLCKVFYFWL